MSKIKKIEKDKLKAISLSQWKEVADLCNCLGHEYEQIGQVSKALDLHLEELHYQDLISDHLGVAVAHRRIAECYTSLSNFTKSLIHLKKFLGIVVSVKDQTEEQRAWATLGRTYYLKHSHDTDSGSADPNLLKEAVDAYLQALKLADDIKETITEKEHAKMKARLFLNLGLVCESQENMFQAMDHICKAIFFSSKFGLYEDLCRCQTSLASMYENHKDYNSALGLYDSAISSAEKSGDKTLLCHSLCSKADVFLIMEDFPSAKTNLIKAYKLKTSIKEDHDEVANNLKICIGICECQQKLEKLKSHEYSTKKDLLEKIADGLSSLECYELSIKYYKSTLKCLEDSDSPASLKAPIYFSLAATYRDNGDIQEAVKYLDLELSCYADNSIDKIKTLWKMAELLEEEKSVDIVERKYLQALSLTQLQNSKKIEYKTLQKLRDFYKNNSLRDKASSIREKLEEDSFEDISSDEDEEDISNPFDDIVLTEIPELNDNIRRKPQRQYGNKKNESGETCLQQACIKNDLKKVQFLVQNGHDINVRDNCGWTPLHEVCNLGHYDIAEYLLDKGAAVNDRGLSKCRGVTPLHDAATNGHLEIIHLLISRGASILENDEGRTPLQELIYWRFKEDDLDEKTSHLYEEIISILERKMNEAGYDANDVAFGIDDVTLNDNQTQCRLSGDKRKHSTPDTDSDDQICFKDDSSLSDHQTVNVSDDENAASEYKAVMSSLRRSAKTTKFDQVASSNLPALISEDENVTKSEWLISDTNQPRKVKHGQYRIKDKPEILLKDHNEEDVASKDFPSLSDHQSAKTTKFDPIASSSSSSLIYEDTSECLIKNTAQPRKKIKVKPGLYRIKDLNLLTIKPHSNENNSEETNITQQKKTEDSSTSLFCLNVRINDKQILIPVPDDSSTIEWLEKEATERYLKVTGVRPQLILTTSEGSMLINTDLVKDVLHNKEEVFSIVESLERPSLSESYMQLCHKKGNKPSKFVEKKLLHLEKSSMLNLSNCSLANNQFKLIFLSLSKYNTMTHLNLEGSIVGDKTAKHIIDCLNTFTSLIGLNLSGCGLTGETINNLANSLKLSDGVNKLAHLQVMNLSENIFCFTSSSFFEVILSKLSNLLTFNLESCSLTQDFFENDKLCSVLQSCQQLQELNVARNTMSKKSIENYLLHLPRTSLKKLNLSHVLSYKSNFSFELTLINLLCKGIPQLQELSLVNCKLSSENAAFLAKGFKKCGMLKCCNFSENILSVKAVCLLIKELSKITTIDNIYATGTCEWNKDSLVLLKETLTSCKFIQVAIDGVPKHLRENLSCFWKELNGCNAQFLQTFCLLSLN